MDELDSMSLQAIMTTWPATLRVFIDWRLYCIGCPIAGYHRMADAAYLHGYSEGALRMAIRLAIEGNGSSSTGPPQPRRRSNNNR